MEIEAKTVEKTRAKQARSEESRMDSQVRSERKIKVSALDLRRKPHPILHFKHVSVGARGGSRPMQAMRMHRSEFHVNLMPPRSKSSFDKSSKK